MAMIQTYETVPVEFDCVQYSPDDRTADLLRCFDALEPLRAFVIVAADDPTPLLQRLQAERPGLFEWSSLEEGPPTWKIEIARRDSCPGEAREITEALEWDHDRLDRLERVAFDVWGAGDLREAEAAFARFAHGLRRHIGFEEALIFPEFERRIGIASTFGPTATMRAEHRQILALLAAIELAIDSDTEPVALLLRHLRELLRTHDRKEEQILYPVTDSLLTCEQRNDLIRRIQLFHEE
jgi:uncharacterized protein (DUF2249 family)